MSTKAPNDGASRMHFSVDGEGLTRVLRGLFEEGRAGHALRTTMSAMMGCTIEQAFGLLTGKVKLINVLDSDEVQLVDDDTAVSTYTYGDDPERPAPVDLDSVLKRLDWFERRRDIIDLCNDASAIIHAAAGTSNLIKARVCSGSGQLVGSPVGMITPQAAVAWLARHVPYDDKSWERFWNDERRVEEMREIREDLDDYGALERHSRESSQVRKEKSDVTSEILAGMDPVKRMEMYERTVATLEKMERRRSILDYACYLEITSFVDIGSIGAEHYYGHLYFRRFEEVDKGKEIQLTHPLSAREAKHLNKKDGGSFGGAASLHRPGEQSYRFESKEEIRKVAIEQYLQHFPKAEGLIEGSPAAVDPQPILHGYPDIAGIVDGLVGQMKAIGGYERGGERAKQIHETWYALTTKPENDPT